MAWATKLAVIFPSWDQGCQRGRHTENRSVYRLFPGFVFYPQVVAGDLSKDEPLKGDMDQESNANDDNVSANETDTNHKDNTDDEGGTVHTVDAPLPPVPITVASLEADGLVYFKV